MVRIVRNDGGSSGPRTEPSTPTGVATGDRVRPAVVCLQVGFDDAQPRVVELLGGMQLFPQRRFAAETSDRGADVVAGLQQSEHTPASR
ncbi:hypothetical protein GCM10011575_32210 [Microlunatus endophyticus]|uniref:Uncharacterized protein n=2 Tax=Microlunatus endophyticus TaxID=1716077 RepID=A0A917SEG3_9ACTN|nr:hypothetical protein GCM10011575_32210 [Microlunatus endophyticus]